MTQNTLLFNWRSQFVTSVNNLPHSSRFYLHAAEIYVQLIIAENDCILLNILGFFSRDMCVTKLQIYVFE